MMAIKRRDAPPTENLQVPATERIQVGHTPSPGAFLHTAQNPKRAAFVMYADGTNPMDIPTDDLVTLMRMPDNDYDMDRVYRNRIRSKATGIRAFCVFCAGSSKKVRTCESIDCALWAFRMGNNPFRRKK